MLQRKLGMYVANKIKDEIMAPPRPAADEVGDSRRDERPDRYEREERYDELDGQILRDGEGNSLGRAYRVPDVAVYVIARDGRNPSADLARAIKDDPSRLVFQTTESGRISSVIYIADEAPSVGGLRGARADDV